MKIAVLGTGIVGKTVAKDLIDAGFDVVMGTRDPSKEELLQWQEQEAPLVKLKTFKEAPEDSQLIICAVNFENLEGFFSEMDGADLDGKVIIDLGNPLTFKNGGPELAIGLNDSMGERMQKQFSTSHVVKGLNIVTAANMINPDFSEGIADMFIAGDSNEAKRQVSTFLESVGWRVVDLGSIEMSRYLEPLAMIWIKYAIDNQTSSHAFSLLRK